MWLVTNINKATIDTSFVFKTKLYSFYSDEELTLDLNDDTSAWFITGHIFPRNNVIFKNTNTSIWLSELNKREGSSFINSVKGNFVLVQYSNYGFKIYSDRFAIRKFFYWVNAGEFIISDTLDNILQIIKAKPSEVSMAIYALTYHFTGKRTLFDNVFHNEPGHIISFDGRDLKFEYYWRPVNLLNNPKKAPPIGEIANQLQNIINICLDKTGSDKISLSLTGGADTRNLLALFLKSGIKPHLYTYGDPESVDCIKAKAIAKGLEINHSIHEISIDPEVFERYGMSIIKSSGGLCSFHRAHRLMAVEREIEFADYMFLGSLGGEFIKGVSEDDYIVPEIVYNNWDVNLTDPDLLDGYFKNRFLVNGDVLKEEVFSFLKNEPYLNGSRTERKLCALSYITAHLHDAQDLNLFCSVMKDVFTPFLDIDYLELIFSSGFSFDVKEKHNCKLIGKINNPVYSAKFINATFPELLKYTYSGEHRGDEVLFNKYYAAIAKVVRKRNLKDTYKANFPLGDWMLHFVEANLPICNDYDIIKNTFDLDKMLKSLKNSRNTWKEAYWIKFTNPIMMRYIIDNYQR